ncbi:uncharacterized protein BDZ99DRAFT_466078 [Mytilinidion resinicola]|uniref:Uncharacterized protein n=1 Tax=Mytilinidion resinicola TaxID=574789 RepID=A0A6A6YCH3_9PEZI|nr:uncharacterized protein BDZ99DRAFT_466078 [Mytilinidion resinicola]KAF2806511.1 hypothetical protein BDZ99DRAFT_466078 [Mytilinidion resinicola]
MFRVPSLTSDAPDDSQNASIPPAAEAPRYGTPGESQTPPRTMPAGWVPEPAWMVSQTEASIDSYSRGSGFYFPEPTREVLQVDDSVPPAWSSQEHYTGRAPSNEAPSQIITDSYSDGVFAGGRLESFDSDGRITPTQSTTNSVRTTVPSFFKPHLGLDYAQVSYSANRTIRLPLAPAASATSSRGSDASSMRSPLAPAVRTPPSRANVAPGSSRLSAGLTTGTRYPGTASSPPASSASSLYVTAKTTIERSEKLTQHKASRPARQRETDRNTTGSRGIAQPPSRQRPSSASAGAQPAHSPFSPVDPHQPSTRAFASQNENASGPSTINASAPASSTPGHGVL